MPKPLPHQADGVRAFQRLGGRTLLAWDPGCGKTFGAILIGGHVDADRTVVVCPEHLTATWVREYGACSSRRVIRYRPTGGLDLIRIWQDTPRAVLIVGYASLSDFVVRMPGDAHVEYLVLDECHYLKNAKSLRTKAAKRLARRVPYVTALSGTPIPNRPIELWPVLQMLRPDEFQNYLAFGRRFCAGKRTPFGWDFTGASRLDELHALLTGTVMHRVLKAEVLRDLPAQRRVVVPIEINNRSVYRQVEEEARSVFTALDGAAREVYRDEALPHLAALRQLAVQGKAAGAIRWIDDFLAGSTEKLVVFCHHKMVAAQLAVELRDWGVRLVTGDHTQAARDDAVQSFQTDPGVRLLFATFGAAATGLTLTAASNVAFLEFDWVPATLVQAENRVHRIGQAQSCTAWYLTAAETIDEPMVAVLHAKAQQITQALDGADAEIGSVFDEVLAQLRKDVP